MTPFTAMLMLMQPGAVAEPAQPEPVEIVESVYDGDTFTLARRWDYGLTVRVRIIGIDTPEAGRLAQCARERRAAEAAGEHLRRLIAEAGNAVTLRNVQWDAYGGRIDARVYVRRAEGEADIGAMMITAGHARAYDGRTARQPWCGRNDR